VEEPPIADETTERLLEEDIRTRPAATVEERRRYLIMRFAGKSLSEPTLRRLLKRMGFSRKKGLWGRKNETSS
jgi:transposase